MKNIKMNTFLDNLKSSACEIFSWGHDLCKFETTPRVYWRIEGMHMYKKHLPFTYYCHIFMIKYNFLSESWTIWIFFNRKRWYLFILIYSTANNFLKLLATQTGGRFHMCHSDFDAQLFAHKLLTEGFGDTEVRQWSI